MLLTWYKKVILVSLVLLSACSTTPPPKGRPTTAPSPSSLKKVEVPDGPPLEEIDVSLIPNATPKIEPFSKYGNPPTYQVFGKNYRTMAHNRGYQAKGTASWYGRKFHGQKTSSGEAYDMFSMTAAHRSLPLPTYAKVKNLANGKEIIVKINDRGPFVEDRLIDLSYAAAKKLGIYQQGVGKVHVTAIDPALWYKNSHQQLAKATPSISKGTRALDGKSSHQGKQHSFAKAPAAPLKKTTGIMTTAQSASSLEMPHPHAVNKETLLASTSKQIYLQLGTFNQKLNAQQLVNEASVLTRALQHAEVRIFPHQSANKALYKVRVGPLKSKEEAEKLQKKWLALNKTATLPPLIYE